MPIDSTTVRMTRRSHAILLDLAAQQGVSLIELLDRLAERARRDAILRQSNERLTELFQDPAERAAYMEELDQV